MQKIPLREGEGPYAIEHSYLNQETNRVEHGEVLFNVRAYGEAPNGPPSVFMLSESSQNQHGDISSVAPRIGAKLCQEFGHEGFKPDVGFIVHYPENVKGNNPETFVKAEFRYEGSSPRWDHHSSEISSDEVAGMIGRENMEPGYDASPRQSQDILVQKAFKSGLDR